jgi:hypothetical protein
MAFKTMVQRQHVKDSHFRVIVFNFHIRIIYSTSMHVLHVHFFNKLPSTNRFLRKKVFNMTKFDYAQSNSLLKQGFVDRPADNGSLTETSSASSSAAAAPDVVESQKIPRWRLDGADDNNGIPEEGPPLKKKARQDSRISSQASKNASADTYTSALATICVPTGVITTAHTAGPASAPAAASTSSKKNQNKIPAKKTNHTKHKLANDAAATAKPNTASATAAAAAIQNQSETQLETVTPLSDTTPVGPSGSDGPAQTDVANFLRKSRIRKPRRVIPNEKEYIPANEQPTQSDVVGGRGGESCPVILYDD